MSTAVALPQTGETRWTFLSGKLQGAVFTIHASSFAIGRNADCQLIVDDPKCSRRHAEVKMTPVGFQIQSLVNENPVIVNGKLIGTAMLNDGDIVLLGETEVKFSSGAAQAPNLKLAPVGTTPSYSQSQSGQLQSRPTHNYMSAPQRPQPQNSAPRSYRSPNSSNTQGPNRLIILVVIIGAVFYWLLSPSKKEKAEIAVRTEKQIEADIKAAEEERANAEAAAAKREDSSFAAREAQENYVRGFRDYKKGQYESSQISFQACLALNPKHTLCNRYLRLSQRKNNELIQYQIVLGRKFRSQNQYRACRSAFRNVMVMVNDINNATYREAKANFEACSALMEGRY